MMIKRPGRFPPPRASRLIFSEASSSFRFVVTVYPQYMRTLYGAGPAEVALNGERRRVFGEGRRPRHSLDKPREESYGPSNVVVVARLTHCDARW